MVPSSRYSWILVLAFGVGASVDAQARTVYRCMRDGTVSLSTAPEPGSRCRAVELDDRDPRRPNLWGALGDFTGTVFRREQDGRIVYGTRELPGAEPLFGFAAQTPRAQAHAGMGRVGAPRLDVYADQFRASARESGVDDAWLRTIAHVESGFDRLAQSHKGAQGVMQLMPATAAEYGVSDPFASDQSIRAGAMHLRDLMSRFDGDLSLVAAAYNAGIGTLQRYGGMPPYPETQAYVARVLSLYPRYREALAEGASKRSGKDDV